MREINEEQNRLKLLFFFFLFTLITYKMGNISNYFENEKQGTSTNTFVS